jgi:hypothetical protein
MDAVGCHAASMRMRSVRTVLAVVVIVAGIVVVRLFQIHQETWEWRLTPSATPPKLHVLSRDYRREHRYQAPPSAASWLGMTPGGSPMLGETVRSFAPTVIWVKSHQAFEVYTLMGGP